MIRKKYEWLFHLLGSLLFLSIPLFNSGLHPGKSGFFVFDNMAKQDLIRYALLLAFFYLNYFYLIPRLYFTRHYIFYFLLLIVFMYSIAALPGLFIKGGGPAHFPKQVMNPGFGPGGPPRGNFFFARINHNVFLFMAVAFFGLLLRMRNRWLQTEKEKLNAELSYLKAQINPHFLFNTLNSIYSLAIQKSDSTPEAVQKLSTMMRYILTEATVDFVPLQKEIDYIRNYINLQQLRFGNDLTLNYSIWGDEKNKKIAPLVLISFIENAFKYGINAEEDTNIKIVINIYETRLEMLVSNNIVTVQENEEMKSGIGLENTRSRLELVYPYAHKLQITEDEKTYHVNLSIDLI